MVHANLDEQYSLQEFCNCCFDYVQIDMIKFGTLFAKTHPESERDI